MSRLVPVLLALALWGCAAVELKPRHPDIYVMRHLERAGSADALSAEGAANAERLATWFGKSPPAAIFASTTRRAQDSAAPLARRLGPQVKSYDPKDSDALAAMVLSETGKVLVVGHSNTVPEIVEKLGGARPTPIDEKQYGDIFRVHGLDRTVTRYRLGGD